MDRLAGRAWRAYENMLYYRLGVVPADPRSANLITYSFLHLSWAHLLGNLLILYLAGCYVEDAWGRPLYLAFFVLAGMAAALVHVAHHADSIFCMVGSSGAIAGVMGAFAVRFWKARVKFLVGFHVLAGTFTISAWLVIGIWFAKEMLLARVGMFFGVARWAHVGGFVFGALFALLIALFGIESRFIHPAIRRRSTKSLASAPLLEALEAHREGHDSRAMKILRREVIRDPLNFDAVVAFWDAAVARHRPEAAAPHLERIIAAAARRDDSEIVLTYWPELRREMGRERLDLGLLALVAEMLDRVGWWEKRDETLDLALRSEALKTHPGTLRRLARLARDGGAPPAGRLVAMALAHPEIPDSEKRELAGAAGAVAGLG